MIKECSTCSKNCEERKLLAKNLNINETAINVFECPKWEPPGNKYSEAISFFTTVVYTMPKDREHIQTAIEALEAADLTERIQTDTLPAVRQISDFTELKEQTKELYGRE